MRLAVLLCAGAAFAQSPVFLLPEDAAPKKYTIDLTIDPSKPVFDGWARIDVELKKPAAVLWLNAKDLTPGEAFVGKQKARAEAVGGEFLSLTLDSPVGPGAALISIRYRGKLDEKAIVGPYRKQVAGDWYVFTSFTPIDARRAFPCFDEPRYKTPWEFTIHVPRGDRAFANGKEGREIEEAGGMTAVHFARTEPLPAEVVAFTVGPLETTATARAGHGTPIRVIAPRGHASEGKSALEAAADVLPRLEAYTGIPYPFGKLDHLADPEFPFGATENPGLIVYRMRSLLATPAEATPEKVRAIRRVESHEMAHQWFGDMVTQASWEDVWLSEGFATWLSDKIMDEYLPPERRHLAAVAARERIMGTDASPRTRPVRRAMHSREEIRDVYNQMVYQKGAALLLMLEGWLGEDRMQAGLRSYLKSHRFGNASTADLEAALRAAGGSDPAPVMDWFLNGTGVPTISAEVRCEQGSARIAIQRPPGAVVPVCARSDAGSAGCTTGDSIELKSCPAWAYFNAGGTGYYRTQWSEAQIKALDLSRLTPAERLTLVFDLRRMNPRLDVPSVTARLAADAAPEIAKAAEALQQTK